MGEVVQLFTPKLRLKGVQVQVDPFPAHAVVEGDADAIKQVFFNLLYNAIQAIHHDHGRVHIDARAGAAGCVHVTDNGMGMDETTRAAIFQPFVTRKQGYGTGLGLSLSQTIMKQHGGTIARHRRAGRRHHRHSLVSAQGGAVRSRPGLLHPRRGR